jgi:hypothetical protein
MGKSTLKPYLCEESPAGSRPLCPLHGAAPKLLEALKDLTALYEASPGRDPGFVSKAIAVIAKAEGRAP